MTDTIRIQTLMAQSGVGSRRQCDRWVAEGKVTVNGQKAKIGQMVSRQDDIRLAGKLIARGATETRLLLLNKPSGYVCSKVAEGDMPSVYQLLPHVKSGRWCLVGRLDVTTTGLLLVTNSGSFAQQLTHPSNDFVRTYRVRIFGKPPQGWLKQLKEGTMIDGEKIICQDAKWMEKRSEGHNQWVMIKIHVGRQHIIKKICDAYGLTVTRLIRTGFGRLLLPKPLSVGSWVELDVKAFKEAHSI